MNNIFKYLISVLVACLGFLLVHEFNTVNSNLAQINLELVEMKIKLNQLENTMMTEERVKQIVEMQIMYFNKQIK